VSRLRQPPCSPTIGSSRLAHHGHKVINPALDDDFAAALATAYAEFDEHQPQGSSRAMNIDAGALCPAWK